jgi:hypothetical protein
MDENLAIECWMGWSRDGMETSWDGERAGRGSEAWRCSLNDEDVKSGCGWDVCTEDRGDIDSRATIVENLLPNIGQRSTRPCYRAAPS